MGSAIASEIFFDIIVISIYRASSRASNYSSIAASESSQTLLSVTISTEPMHGRQQALLGRHVVVSEYHWPHLSRLSPSTGDNLCVSRYVEVKNAQSIVWLMHWAETLLSV